MSSSAFVFTAKKSGVKLYSLHKFDDNIKYFFAIVYIILIHCIIEVHIYRGKRDGQFGKWAGSFHRTIQFYYVIKRSKYQR